eukprot:PLAT13143.2.p1 GENE.PLAT13143.2~~PLAT13143.2.p1  ORF type:complete len:116 (-),score=10.39 PLAT13143.2:146-493(-)
MHITRAVFVLLCVPLALLYNHRLVVALHVRSVAPALLTVAAVASVPVTAVCGTGHELLTRAASLDCGRRMTQSQLRCMFQAVRGNLLHLTAAAAVQPGGNANQNGQPSWRPLRAR